jgi:hypothetical protein
MNPYKLREIYKYLTRAKKTQPDLPDVFPASKAPIPPKTQNVEEIEAINRFNRANPRTEKAGGGMLVQPSADGSRPGYRGDPVEPNIRLRENGNAYDVEVQRGPQIFRKSFNLKDYKNKNEALKAAQKFKKDKLKIPFKTGIQEPMFGSRLDKKEYMKKYHEKTRTLTEAGKLAKERDLKLKNFIGKKKKINASTLRDFVIDELGYDNYSASRIKQKFPNLEIVKDIKTGTDFKPLNKKQIEIVKENFDLPEGVEKWNFKQYKNGISAAKYPNLFAQIQRRLDDKNVYKVAANFSDPQGWMISAMNRLYENETTLLEDGTRVLKEGVDKLTYEPKFNKKGIIVGFKDNTAAGKGNIYYGTKKAEKNYGDGTDWRVHGDFSRVNKFLDIANGVRTEPNKILQKILTQKGINVPGLTLNDVLSHKRYYNVLSDTAPRALLNRQIVLHHIKGVGDQNVARAAATKDIQLLTDEINSKVMKLENIVKGTSKNPARKLTKDEILKLKNYGAKIQDFDGKVVGGGFRDPTTQFASIEKGAIEYAKGKDFNIKTVNSYLERIGCGKSGGGRVLYNQGAFGLTKCAEKGVNVIKEGNYKTAEQAQDAAKLLSGGKNVLRAITKYGIIPEAAFVAGESLFRTALGEEPLNALKKSIDSFTFGATDFTSGIEAEKFGKFSNQKLAVDKFRSSQTLVDSLQNKLANLKAITDQGGEGYVGDLSSDIQMTQAQLQAAEQELQKNTVSPDLVQFIDKRGQEIADTQMAKSDFAKRSLKDQMDGIPGIRDYTDTESTRIFPKQPSQMDLNLNLFPTLPTDLMQLKTSGAINLAQGLREEGQNVSAKDVLAYRDSLKQMPLSEQARIYGDEQIYGTQGADVLQPLAGGGIAKLAGVSSGVAPESGPNPQGLLSLKNRVRNY